jgi:hypothetical protein
MYSDLRLGINKEAKIVDREKAKALALQAIRAEWNKDYLVAEFKWICTLRYCRPTNELLCTNRAETCRKVSAKKATLIF